MDLSIIIPAYNEEKRLAKCLQSVLSQEYLPAHEVMVVDNASSDNTANIVKKDFPQVKLFFELQKGVTRARNRGAEEAKGDILIFFDADVVVPKDYVKRILAKFQQDKNLILASGPYAYTIDSNFYIKFVLAFVYQFLASPAEYFFNRWLNFASSLNAGNFAVIRDCFLKVGGFNKKISFFGDEADLSLKIRKLGKVRFFLDLVIASSARRFQREGVLRLCLKYALNVIWPVFFKKPFTKNYIDVR